ncbi:MAG TPA: ATP-binding cassette domain-containing protein, partial [Firmicutes bacterium]|nr:ATP-binding cassette domain-containing protein [Bacillota bacterium]
MSNVLVQTRNLTKCYGTFTAVDGLNLSVKAGEIYGFLGPNGSGKTTTIRMLTGLLDATEGEAFICGY